MSFTAGVLPAIGTSIGGRVREDAIDAYRRAPNKAYGVGAAAREAVVGPVSHAIEGMVNVGAPVRDAISDVGSSVMRGVVGAPPAPKPAAPKTPVNASQQVMRGSIEGNGGIRMQPGTWHPEGWDLDPQAMMKEMLAGVQASREAAAAPAMPSAPQLSLPAVSAAIQPQAGAALGAPAVSDPNAAIMASLNDGTWSGMINAKTMAKRADADRAAAVAAANANTASRAADNTAELGRMNAAVSAFNANTAARKGAAEGALIGENIQNSMVTREGAQVDLKTKKEEAALRQAAAAGDEKALAKLRNLEAARKGKNSGDEQNEKLLDAYLKSVAEHNKDPANMGKPMPTFEEFMRGLPRGMFPSAERHVKQLPEGMKRQVGTQNGVPVFEDAQGKRFTMAN